MGRLTNIVPILEWLPAYKRGDLRFDVIAGITVSALVIPKALGYAGIARVPVENGLYAAAVGGIVYALFATSRQISTGPSGALAAVAGGAVALAAVSEEDAAPLVAAVTIATGALFILLSVFKMGWISQFLSKAVITGFLFGAAIDVVVGELPKLTGTSADGSTVWRQLGEWFQTLDTTHMPTLALGLISIAGILALRFTFPKIPGALALVVFGLAASTLFNLEARDIAVVGEVPRGLPAFELPDGALVKDHYATILAAAFALVLIGFSQTAGDARTFAARHQYRIDVDQETVAQGMANVTAGVLQGMPVSTSLSASSLNDSSGARTGLASLVMGGVVILTLLVLAPLFSDLPKAVLGALIIDAVVFGMMDVREMRRMWRVTRFDFWIALFALLAVLSGGVLAGVIVGIALSLVWLVYVSTHPSMPELVRLPDSDDFQPLSEHAEGVPVPGVLLIRLDGGLFFATSDTLETRLREAVLSSEKPITAVIIDFAAVNFIDSQGSSQLTKISTLATNAGVSLRLARVKRAVMAVLDADGVCDAIGRDRLHGSITDAVRAETDGQSPELNPDAAEPRVGG